MKWCLYSRKCPWGNAFYPGYCALENENCKIDDDAWSMLDLDADIPLGNYEEDNENE